MKALRNLLCAAAISAGTLMVSSSTASAQLYTPGDLLVGFLTNGAGSGNFVIANLGQASTYRDTAVNHTGIVNVATALSNQFGPGWANRTDLYMGAFSSWDADAFNESLNNGDPTYTVYVSFARTAPGTPGAQNSSTDNTNDLALTTAGTNALLAATDFGSRGSGNPSTISDAGSFNDFMDQNPVGGTAYGAFSSGTIKAFGAGTFGPMASITAENALDVFRYQWRNDLVGQYGFGQPTQTDLANSPEFLGSVVIDGSGDISFVAIPEPSTYALLVLAGAAVIFVRLRRVNTDA